MSLKLSFNSEIHKLHKLPTSFKALIEAIQLSYSTSLPEHFALHYVDSEGDCIMISNDHDFKSLQETLSDSSISSLKLFIVPSDSETSILKREVSHEVITKETIQVQEPKQVEVEKPKIEELIPQIDESAILPPPKEDEVRTSTCVYECFNGYESAPQVHPYEDNKQSLEDLVTDILMNNLPQLAVLLKDMVQVPEVKPVPKKEEPKVEVPKVEAPKPKVHHGYTCDECGKVPQGARYHCSVCSNFDLCEQCEKTSSHNHVFLKIKEPVSPSIISHIPHVIKATLFNDFKLGSLKVTEEKPKVEEKPVETKQPEISPEVKKIVDKLKEIFPQADTTTVVELVSANKGMSFEELVLNYLGN